MGPRLRGDDSGTVNRAAWQESRIEKDVDGCDKPGHDERARFGVDDARILVEPALFHRNFRSPWFQPTGTAALAEGCPMG